MKKPRKPKKPTKPVEPSKVIKTNSRKVELHDGDSVSSIQESAPNGYLEFETEYGYYGNDDSIRVYAVSSEPWEEPNRYYKSQMTRYEKSLKTYQRKLKNYQGAMQVWEIDNMNYEQWLKEDTLRKDEAAFEELKKKLGK